MWTSRVGAETRKVELRYSGDDRPEEDWEPCDIAVPAVIGNSSNIAPSGSEKSKASKRRGHKGTGKNGQVDKHEMKNKSFAEGRSGTGRGRLAKMDQSATASSKQSGDARQKCKTARPRNGAKEGTV